VKKNIYKHPVPIMIILLVLSEVSIYCDIGKSVLGMISIRLILGIIIIATMYGISDREVFIWSKGSLKFAFCRSSYQLILCSLSLILALISDLKFLNNNWLSIIISSFSISVSVGFFEEGLYRGIILNGLVRLMPKNKSGLYKAVIVSGLFFGFIHVWSYMTVIGTNPLSIIVQMTSKTISTGSLGILLAVIYLKTKNIWVCMIIHALNNFPLFVLVTIFEIKNVQYVDTSMDLMTALFSIPSVFLIGIPNIIIALFVLKRLKPEECIIWK